ncbi:MAG: TetR/AcrR family transcriptional regulator [Gaiellales bacterium]
MAVVGQDTGDRLRAIAAHLFATRGFGATSMRHIANEGGVTAGAIYNHFASKEAILNDIARGFHAQLHDRLRAEAAACKRSGETSGATLDRLVRELGRTVVERPAVCRASEGELVHLAPRHRAEVQEIRQAILELLDQALVAAVERGERTLPPSAADAPRRVVTSIVNMLTGLSEARPEELEDGELLVEMHVDLVRRITGR